MIQLATEALALGSATIGWGIAARAARRRHVQVGAPPLAALAGVALIAALRTPAGAASPIVIGGVAVAAITDVRTGRVFTPFTLALGLAALVAAAADGDAPAAAAGMLAAGGALLALYVLTSGRGIGLGDVRLGCSVGAALGAVPALVALAWAFVLGGAFGVVLLVTKRAQRNSAIPFAPFIAATTIVASLAWTSL
jgi:prepilin signal peptidase PulO-like enzyme (type II secretory pathway)